MLRVIVVDDEAPARRLLRRMLAARQDVQVVGEAADREQAVGLIQSQQPDALFLDIDLIHGTGFDLLRGLDPAPSVVFVTAHPDYAARAFEVAAIDYLLKPVPEDRLDDALARLRRAKGQGRGQGQAQEPAYLIVRGRHDIKPIKVDTLSAAMAHGDYVRLYCADGSSELMYTTLTRLAPQLPAPVFLQVSRSLIVNLDHVANLRSMAGKRQVEFRYGALPLELGETAFVRLRRKLVERAELS